MRLMNNTGSVVDSSSRVLVDPIQNDSKPATAV
jgi:hypothetical protein